MSVQFDAIHDAVALDRLLARWRRPFASMLVLALFIVYVSSYLHLSRRGMHEAKTYNMSGFFYVSIAEVVKEKDLSRHYARVKLYAPLNWLDQRFLGNPGPVRGLTWGLSR